MDSVEIIDLLDPPEVEIHNIYDVTDNVQSVVDEYMKNTKDKIMKAMMIDMLNIYMDVRDGQS